MNTLEKRQEIDILIFSRDYSLVDQIGKLLSQEGYCVEVTDNSFQIIRTVLAKNYKTLILDLENNEIGTFAIPGIEVISIVHKISSKLPILTITNNSTLEFQRKVREERIFYYFVKPVDMEEMKAVVKDALKMYGK